MRNFIIQNFRRKCRKKKSRRASQSNISTSSKEGTVIQIDYSKLDYDKLAEAMLKRQGKAEEKKDEGLWKTIKEKCASIDVYTAFYFGIKAGLFLISSIAFALFFATMCIFLGYEQNDDMFVHNPTVFIFAVICFIVYFITDKANVNIRDISDKKEIKEIFNSLVGFLGMSFAVSGIYLKEIIMTCLNELLKNPQCMLLLLPLLMVTILKHIFSKEKHKCDKANEK